VQSGEYTKKIDNFLVILDASGSMNQYYKGQRKFDIARDIVSGMNQTIPDLGYTGGLRTFGQSWWYFSKKTTRVYGMTPYSQGEFQGALEAVKPVGGISPLARALDSASADLQASRGKIAVILVSDGREMDSTPVAAAKNLRDSFGDRLCIYTVLVGDSLEGKRLLEEVATAGRCGFAVSADEISSSEGMARFVEGVFLAKRGKPSDRDGDGVPDTWDKCPDTPRGVEVDARGCPLDSDGDGVYDYLDKCPDTPKGDPVDATGCTVVAAPLDTDEDGVYDYADQCPNTPKGAKVDQRGCWVIQGIQFDTSKADIKSSSYPVLNEVVDVLRQNPTLRVEIQGHTDSTGSASFNKILSQNRAKAVLDYFASKGISRNRLSAMGYGPNRPVASNSTPEGRALNRRVELKPLP
jgi:OOP family OmpA-OmpF porin